MKHETNTTGKIIDYLFIVSLRFLYNDAPYIIIIHSASLYKLFCTEKKTISGYITFCMK